MSKQRNNIMMILGSAFANLDNPSPIESMRSIRFAPPPHPKRDNPNNHPMWSFTKSGELTQFPASAYFSCYALNEKSARKKFDKYKAAQKCA